ncbi:MAG: PEP-CTERM sorting domain-containing protein [Rhodopila sp.]|nr:PEP-CTERM sorting domain-containing protein [Rhodopila sp.]
MIALIPLAVGMITLPGAAHAAPIPSVVSGSFSGTLGTVTAANFAGEDYEPGDVFTGTFTYTSGNFDSTFTATITDVTTGSSFTLPAGYTTSGGASGTPDDFVVTAHDSLVYPDYTPFTLDLVLEGTLAPGGLPNTLTFTGGTGSVAIDVAAEPVGRYNTTGNPEETLTVDLNIPEPLSIGLFGFALASLASVKRRAKR